MFCAVLITVSQIVCGSGGKDGSYCANGGDTGGSGCGNVKNECLGRICGL